MSVRAVEYICTFVPLRCTLILYPVPVIIRAEPRLQFFILRFNFLTELWLVFCDVSCVWTYMIHLAIRWQLTHRPTIMWHCLSHRLSVYAVSVHRRLGIAGSIMAQLDKVWRQQRLSLSTKLRICTSIVQSVVLYGSETWTVHKVDSGRIQSFHMQALRRILGIRWYDKVSNAVVNERTKLPDVPFLIADRRHSLLVTFVAYRRTHLLRRHCNCQ